ncbi:MAG: acetyl-CoA carboxylase biotin carboxylase subunit [Pseudomonadota bacterium]
MADRFNSVLVANRGEIAVRVIRSARDSGYRTIAVYSEADSDAPHVHLADEAVCVGAAPVGDSYLNADHILEAARATQAQAIHPGYGFLSENADFAQRCIDCGIVFIGPSPRAIELMGNKAAAKRHMIEAGVPCIPGYQSSAQEDEKLLEAAAAIGAPIMVKAAAGGGGRGMRLVQEMAELPAALAAARSEALNAFGSDELILEKAVLRPRHVEIQVFGDDHGSVIHLGERDCSVQRRHQKVVEESPCPVMTDELRDAMGSAAVAAAKSIDYVGAGTVEFLLAESGDFFFLEMNTRLQVEHPVTELVTGLDLVDLQLRVAQGEPLPLEQHDVAISGHAIEVRLYAEDTINDFLPASGTAQLWVPPTDNRGIRVDHGLASGLVVSPFYDPMIAKIIAYDDTRSGAIRRLRRSLCDTLLFGMETNREFLIDVLDRESFADGTATTAFIAEEFPDGVVARSLSRDAIASAGLIQFLEQQTRTEDLRPADATSAAVSFKAASLPARFVYASPDITQAGASGSSDQEDSTAAGNNTEVLVSAVDADAYLVMILDEEYEVRIIDVPSEGRIRLAWNNHMRTVAYCLSDHASIELQIDGRQYRLRNELATSAAEQETGGSGAVLAPMHGSVLALRVQHGAIVEVGDELAVIEAMKMEHTLAAEIAGVVSSIEVVEGQQVAANELLLVVEPSIDDG